MKPLTFNLSTNELDGHLQKIMVKHLKNQFAKGKTEDDLLNEFGILHRHKLTQLKLRYFPTIMNRIKNGYWKVNVRTGLKTMLQIR